MTGNPARRIGILMAALTTAGCGSAVAGTAITASNSLPAGVMSAAQACKRVVAPSAGQQSLRGIEQVRLVLTTYAKGEPVQSGGDTSSGMPSGTPVWVVAVHAKVVDVPHSVPPGYKPHGHDDSLSVVMNARTGLVTDWSVGRVWPLPLWKVGKVISLSGRC